MKRALIVLAGLYGLSGVALAAPPQAGFDCAKAQSPLEKAICADPETAEADRAMALGFAALIGRATQPALAAALLADQRSFLDHRRQAFDSAPNRDMAQVRLREQTDLRAEWLNWVNPAPGVGLVGNWGNAWGGIRISAASDGALEVRSDVADQVGGTWLCGFNGPLREVSANSAVGETLAGELQLRRQGDMLEVVSHFCDETGPPINGSMRGLYFSIGAGD